MKVAVLGAGIAGLAAARHLAKAGVSAVAFEKSNALAGRCATRRIEGFTFDSGATSIAPRGKRLQAVMLEELDTTDLVKIEKPIWTMQYGRIAPGDAARMRIERFTYRQGIAQLGKLLGAGLEIRLNCQIESIAREGEQYSVAGELFDAVIVALPAPQAAAVLAGTGDAWRVASVRFRACLSVLLGYETPFDAPYHAVIDSEQRNPVIWISVESLKAPGRAPEGQSAFTAQMGARFSHEHYEDSDFELVREATVMIERLYGSQFTKPKVAQVKRWKYSQPEITTSFEAANRGATRLVLAGDGIAGPRVELAFESGIQAADHLLNQLKP